MVQDDQDLLDIIRRFTRLHHVSNDLRREQLAVFAELAELAQDSVVVRRDVGRPTGLTGLDRQDGFTEANGYYRATSVIANEEIIQLATEEGADINTDRRVRQRKDEAETATAPSQNQNTPQRQIIADNVTNQRVYQQPHPVTPQEQPQGLQELSGLPQPPAPREFKRYIAPDPRTASLFSPGQRVKITNETGVPAHRRNDPTFIHRNEPFAYVTIIRGTQVWIKTDNGTHTWRAANYLQHIHE